jgi:diguanylate cyclase (GGDEF)-like protein
VVARDDAGRAVRAVGLVSDATAQKVLEEQLVRLVMSDTLTGVGNRRAFDTALDKEWRRSQREGASLALTLVDADDFKAINDTHGHVVGDHVLRQLAQALLRNVRRPADVVARFGGEEFAVLLPGAEPEGATVLAQQMLDAVRQLRFVDVPALTLTVSIGLATTRGIDRAAGAAGLLRAADDCLLLAKQRGKDMVVGADDTSAGPR